MEGRIVHFEIPFDDGDRARSFYKSAFGWDIQEMPEMSYTMVSTGPTSDQGMPSEPGFINGGMFGRDGGPSRGPVVVVGVPSIDDALAAVQEGGGATVMAKQAVGEMGHVAYFSDPEGNVLGLWQTAVPG